MVHSFNSVYNANGNVTIEFFEDNKKRSIIFQKDTRACTDVINTLQHYHMLSYMDKYRKEDDRIKAVIEHLRKSYVFKSNPNNVSIFRPLVKTK